MQELKKLWALLWPDAQPTSLLELPSLARLAGVGRVFVKVEGERPLGSFKAFGGMIAGVRALAAARGVSDARDLFSERIGTELPRLICASEGNHGLAVAAAAKKAGSKAIVFLPREVSTTRAARIEAFDAEIVRIDGTYDDAVAAAEAAATRGDGLLISDTANDPDSPVVNDVMAGYGMLADELIEQFNDPSRARPTHSFVQAGVGGLAAAMVDGLQPLLRAPSRFLIVEPDAAPSVARALQVGEPTLIEGDLHTSASMLACGMASAPALRILQRHSVASVLVSDVQLRVAAAELRSAGGPETTESGATGLAGLLQVAARRDLRSQHQLDNDSVVLLIATERA
ncbi:diaminopropionate ammonia-lyase [Steroidobacter agaridevorans]|uniref:Diaminopropionate ammonia-lyase n=1 Tax=Steroidobacter agaridevorans TaxID=2695856 RepID=A0A829YEU5_9GAMM|nr:pyridoxal-phosphate dependent enzyme [Steroidobacter agaridevorans]GFE81804.1 diaminopropionate ammonia-lyase [Steroidobacter agaridevorans]GFE90549.1 diaminopropionate ammonia-lyase [Steroidobacter agaridevorans]